MITVRPPETIPATAPARFVLLQNRDITTVGPKAAPRPAHALDTSPIILLFGFHAMINATTETAITVILATVRTSFESASFLTNWWYKSSDAADAVTRSCESAVDMIAARIPQRKIPPINGNARSVENSLLIISINTLSAEEAPSSPSTAGSRYARPITPIKQAAVSERISHTIAITLDFFNSFSFFTAINRVRICGIPQYPSPHASWEKISINVYGRSPFSNGLRNAAALPGAPLWVRRSLKFPLNVK